MDSLSWTAPPGAAQPTGIQSTAGAVSVYNEKGERSMKKVKVQRYVSGKRPDYAPVSSDEEVSEDEDFTQPKAVTQAPPSPKNKSLTEAEMQDPRLRRLLTAPQKVESEENETRVVHEAEVVEMGEESEDEPPQRVPDIGEFGSRPSHTLADSESESEDEVDEAELTLRRLRMREKAQLKAKEEEDLLGDDDDKVDQSSEEEEESEEYSEESDSEGEAEGPRLKPVFVRRKDRVTIQQKELVEAKQKQTTIESRKRTEERRRETLRLIEQANRAQNQADNASSGQNGLGTAAALADINTDDEADEAEYEAWKLRELKRIKRDKDERDAIEKEKEEVERLRNMTEEERRIQLRINPKAITNKAAKGKYKFLQKYYHRGVFFLDKEDEVFRRDFSGATLEDHFDKTILPKVMQVKNFGRSGRTKYTHLVDQDTTSFDSPWAADSQINHRFSSTSAGGMKQVFERPSAHKKESVSTNSQSAGHSYQSHSHNSSSGQGYDGSHSRR